MDLRKTVFILEDVVADGGERLARPVRRVAAIAVIGNPYAGRRVDDLSPLFDVGLELGTLLAKHAVDLIGGRAVSYGKAAIVGTAGEVEHGAAIIHPKLGKPMREAVGGGEAIIPSNVKVAAPGTSIDVPLGHKDDVWSFDHFDTLTVTVPGAPQPDEILVAIAYADGGRPRPRVGKGRAVV
jgi:hypothetical protein